MKHFLNDKSPCYLCSDRHLICHDSCEKYQNYKRDREKILKKKSFEYSLIHDACNHYRRKRGKD